MRRACEMSCFYRGRGERVKRKKKKKWKWITWTVRESSATTRTVSMAIFPFVRLIFIGRSHSRRVHVENIHVWWWFAARSGSRWDLRASSDVHEGCVGREFNFTFRFTLSSPDGTWFVHDRNINATFHFVPLFNRFLRCKNFVQVPRIISSSMFDPWRVN